MVLEGVPNDQCQEWMKNQGRLFLVNAQAKSSKVVLLIEVKQLGKWNKNVGKVCVVKTNIQPKNNT